MVSLLAGITLASSVTPISFPDRAGNSLNAVLYSPAAPNGAFISMLPGGGAGVDSVAWAADSLSKSGYTVIVTKPARAGSAKSYAEACSSAIDYAKKHQLANRKVGIAGWSLGARALTLAQQDDNRINALVAWDNLAAHENGDQGSPSGGFNPDPSTFRTPRVPALGLASDATPSDGTPEIKKTAFNHWVSQKIDTMEIVFSNSTHFWWSARARPSQHAASEYFTTAWFDYHLLGDQSAKSRLTVGTYQGQPLANILSSKYTSASFVNGNLDPDLRN